jgi:hypothetical protein
MHVISSAELSAFGSRVATMMLMLRHKATRASLSLGLRVARIRACRRARSACRVEWGRLEPAQYTSDDGRLVAA